MLNKIAVLINGIEPIFLSPDNKRGIFVVVLAGTSLEKFVKANFSVNNIVVIKPKTKSKKQLLALIDLLNKTDIAPKLKAKGIKYFVVPHRSSEKIEAWAKKNKIKLIVTPLTLQQKLENKIYFDNLLKKNKIPSPPTLSATDLRKSSNANLPIVVQEIGSYGLFGTKFYHSAAEYLSLRPKIKNVLIRKYLPEMPAVGVSIFLDKNGNFFFSGLRLQCFEYESGLPKNFLGIQWLPDEFFSAKINKKLNEILKKLVGVLKKEKFRGVANFDLLIGKDKILILECNPRLSSATPQIFGSKKLTGFDNSWEFYLNIFTGEQVIKVKNNKLPKHNFQGALLDIDVNQAVKVKRILPVGWYSFENNRIKYRGLKLKRSLKNRFFLFHELAKPQAIKHTTLCTIISDFALFDPHQAGLNVKGKIIYEYFKQSFLGKSL